MSLSSLITPLSRTWTQYPYNDSGQLMGGQRNHQVEMNNLQADVFRNATQAQEISQAARAYSGSDVVNNLTQDEELKQDGYALNEKDIDIAPPDTANVPPKFKFNYLQRVTTDIATICVIMKKLTLMMTIMIIKIVQIAITSMSLFGLCMRL